MPALTTNDDARPLALARIAIGTVFVVRTTALANLLNIPLAHVRGPLFGWPDAGIAFAWGGFVMPESVRVAVAVVRTIAALAFVAGVRARVAGVVAGALGLFALSQDPFGFIYTLYTLFLGTIVVAIGDGTTRWALVPDRALSAASSRRLLQIFVASIYGWSAIAKLSREWLSGLTLLALAEDGLVTPVVRSALLAHDALRVLTAYGAVAIEAALVIAILVPRTRRVAFVVALLFHLTVEIAMRPDVMSFVMASLLVGAAWTPRAQRLGT